MSAAPTYMVMMLLAVDNFGTNGFPYNVHINCAYVRNTINVCDRWKIPQEKGKVQIKPWGIKDSHGP